ncbi:MAG: VWA domain-containing protein [Candidatus Zixiibacteriota bacterium]
MMANLEFGGLGLNLFGPDTSVIPAWIIFLIGAVVLAAMLAYYFKRKRFRSATLKYSDIRIVKRAARSNRQRYRFVLPALRLMAVALFVLAFARPRLGTEVTDIDSEGIDIMMVLDISSSMLAEDFKPVNRVTVAKEELKKFVTKRPNDRIGLVIFSRYAFTQCPLTVDHGVLMNFVDQVNVGDVEDGTAIGMAIATGVNRLRESDSKSKVMVLLTDGDNNAGEIDPLTAANLAAAMGVKIYTIGVGKPGNAMFPYQDPLFGKRYIYQPVRIDEASLREIAAKTGGRYFRAKSGEELDQIYSMIDALEKTKINISAHIQYHELFPLFTYAGLILLALELILTNTYFRKLP